MTLGRVIPFGRARPAVTDLVRTLSPQIDGLKSTALNATTPRKFGPPIGQIQPPVSTVASTGVVV